MIYCPVRFKKQSTKKKPNHSIMLLPHDKAAALSPLCAVSVAT